MNERKAAETEEIEVETERIEKKKVKIRKTEKIKKMRAEAKIKKIAKREAEAGIERTERRKAEETDLRKVSIKEKSLHLNLPNHFEEDHLKLGDEADSHLTALRRLERHWTQLLCYFNSNSWNCKFNFSSNRWHKWLEVFKMSFSCHLCARLDQIRIHTVPRVIENFTLVTSLLVFHLRRSN